MPFETFTDSRGNKHEIYMQERQSSCGIAAVCTLMKLMGGATQVEEAHIRQLSQKFEGGYKPHPMDSGVVRFTFLAELKRKNDVSKVGLRTEANSGMSAVAIANVLAEYNLYSSKQAINDMQRAHDHNVDDTNVDALRGKILLFGVKTSNQTDHAIIIRDVWDDGTVIIYDSASGLVETKDLSEKYPECTVAAYINFQNNICELDLESGQRMLTEDSVILGAEEEPDNINRPK